MTPDQWEFDQWCAQHELDDDTKKALVTKGFNSYRSIGKLDAEKVKTYFGKLLIPGQLFMLQEGVEVINPPPQDQASGSQRTPPDPEQPSGSQRDQEPSTAPVNTTPAAPQPPAVQQDDLQTQLRNGATLSAEQVLELLRGTPAASALLSPPSTLTTGEAKGEKPFLDPFQFGTDRYATKKRNVPDYISSVNRPDANTTLTLGGVEFTSSTLRKVPHDKLSWAQYMEGALRIMRAMVTEDGAQLDTVMDYVNYLIQISTFAQSFPWVNVLQYDRVYRDEQCANGFRWGSGSAFLMASHLQKPAPSPTDIRPKKKAPQTIDPKSGKTICLKYNGTQGCDLVGCRYAHVCKLCFSNHPEVQHKKSPELSKNL